MEKRKIEEIKHYDRQAEAKLASISKDKEGDFEGFQPTILSSFSFCYEWMEKNCQGKKLLDYGCGNGVHSIFPAKIGAEVTGIDLSEPSLELARKRAKQEGIEDKVKFLVMDCEKMDFPDSTFDIVFDGGTFSSIDLNLALPELARVLKPGGTLLGIETFGHNPFTNLKRKINKMTGKRTEWAEEHILKMEDFKKAEKYFDEIEIKFFHLISWLAFPFLGLPGGKTFLKLLDIKDKIAFKIPFFRKYAFKTVFLFSKPKKNG